MVPDLHYFQNEDKQIGIKISPVNENSFILFSKEWLPVTERFMTQRLQAAKHKHRSLLHYRTLLRLPEEEKRGEKHRTAYKIISYKIMNR
jgi:hypothetical protein